MDLTWYAYHTFYSMCSNKGNQVRQFVDEFEAAGLVQDETGPSLSAASTSTSGLSQDSPSRDDRDYVSRISSASAVNSSPIHTRTRSGTANSAVTYPSLTDQEESELSDDGSSSD